MEHLSPKRLHRGGLEGGGGAPLLGTLCIKCGTEEETSVHICLSVRSYPHLDIYIRFFLSRGY